MERLESAENSSCAQEQKLDNAIWRAFYLSVPAAMFARWTGRRALYLPLNGLQRVLWGTMLVGGPVVVEYLRFVNLWQIRDRQFAARAVTALFGSFDEVVDLAKKDPLSAYVINS